MGTLLTLGSMAKLRNVDSSTRDDRAGMPAAVGPYVIEDRLGAGGMGEVYRAYDQRLDRRVAVKHLNPESSEDATVRRRLQREAHAVAKLNHPAIVQIYDVLETDGGDWIVMELVRGRTLYELARSRRLSLAQALFLAGEVASALAESHSKGVVHRDVKTENVMVTASGHAKLLDFGLAKLLLEGAGETVVSIHGTIVGTGRAMSPEQAKGEPVDHRSDLFSLGSLLYELVTGRAPFEGTSIIATLTRICSDSPVPVRDLSPRVPRELAELIDRLLVKDPASRPDNTADVAAEIVEIASRLSPEEAESTPGNAAGDAAGPRAGEVPTPTPTHISRVTVPESSHSVFVKTLVSLSLSEAAELAGRLGEERAREVFLRHDRLVRDLLVPLAGVEVSKGGSFLLVLERPVDAVELALAYHRKLALLADELGLEEGLAGRIGIHLGEIFYREDDPTWGSPPFEVDAGARRVALRTEALAHPGQTLVTQGAADIARRGLAGSGGYAGAAWIPHGKFRFTKIGGTVRIFEARAADADALPSPVDNGEARRIADPTREIPAPMRLRRAGRFLRTAAFAALAAVALGAFAWAVARLAGGPFGATRPAESRTFALDGFENLSERPDTDWLGTALGEILAAHLEAAGGLRRASAGATPDFRVAGDYSDVDDRNGRLRVRLELRRNESRGAWTVTEEADERDLFALASRLGDSMRRQAGFARLSSEERATLRALWPTDPAALRLYAEGIAKSRADDPARARDLFLKAVANEPGHAASLVALSEALLTLGESGLAEEKARRAYELRDGLPLPVVLLLEGAYYRASGHALLDKELHGEARRAFEEAGKRFAQAGDRERVEAVARELASL